MIKNCHKKLCYKYKVIKYCIYISLKYSFKFNFK